MTIMKSAKEIRETSFLSILISIHPAEKLCKKVTSLFIDSVVMTMDIYKLQSASYILLFIRNVFAMSCKNGRICVLSVFHIWSKTLNQFENMSKIIFLSVIPIQILIRESDASRLGPSKNYITPRVGEGVNDFVTYCFVHFEGEGLFCEIVA